MSLFGIRQLGVRYWYFFSIYCLALAWLHLPFYLILLITKKMLINTANHVHVS